ncbi:Dihydroxyacetone kinase 1 like protein [Verticillium longisporum]|nr:Dihydroxyacetone kinase 1 like protein [Verticillium longisporum]
MVFNGFIASKACYYGALANNSLDDIVPVASIRSVLQQRQQDNKFLSLLEKEINFIDRLWRRFRPRILLFRHGRRGMLTTAVTGTIFASPSVEHIRTAIASLVNISQYVLITVTNYTGDVLNFGMPVERAKAAVTAAEMVEVLGLTGNAKQAADAELEAALETKGMQASLRRTVYVGGSGHQ